jgi:hypothetical protein
VMLRRIARALEESNTLAKERMALEHESYARKSRGRLPKPTTEVGKPTTDQWNQRHEREHPFA